MSIDDLVLRLSAVLDPLEAGEAPTPPRRSDFDLNPEMRPARTRELKQAAVLIPIIARETGPTVLLTRRADTLNSHTGQVAFPGGRLDPGEGAVQAALREVGEEVGIDPGRVSLVGLSDRYETGSRFCVTPVVGVIRPPLDLALNPNEVAEAFETPWDFLMDAANHRRDSMVWNGAERWYWAMPWDDAGTERYIWGATAGMIRSLQQKLATAVGPAT